MIDANFFETYGPLKKLLISSDDIILSSYVCPPITMFCDKCKMERTFKIYFSPSLIENNIFKFKYKCTACNDFDILFIVFVDMSNYSLMKLAQWPLWLPRIERELQKSLGKNLGNYKKGLYCEQEGYGIGAFAYYRRIVEDMIDDLLDDLYEMFTAEEKEKYAENMRRAKDEHVTEKKIEIVKDILPAQLKPGGMNPLARLHSRLSEGIHNKQESECLEIATDIRISLNYLLRHLALRNKENSDYIASLKKLQKQTPSKLIPNKK